jgi:hypothetical protein
MFPTQMKTACRLINGALFLSLANTRFDRGSAFPQRYGATSYADKAGSFSEGRISQRLKI